MSASRKLAITVQGDVATVSGATMLVSDEIKRLGKELGLTYRWDEKQKVWIVSGEKLSEFIESLSEYAKGRNIEVVVSQEQAQAVQPAQAQAQARAPSTSLLSALGEVFETKTVTLIYGPPMSGKTTLTVHLAKELLEQGIVKDALVIMDEPNVLFGRTPQIDRARELLGKDRVVFEASLGGVLRRVRDFAKTARDGFIAIDGLGALILEEVARYVLSGEEVIVATPRVSPLVSAFAHYVASTAIEGGLTVLFTSHEQQMINRTWLGQDGKPSFSGRGMHSVSKVWRLVVNPDLTRTLVVVQDRTAPQNTGRRIQLPPLTL